MTVTRDAALTVAIRATYLAYIKPLLPDASGRFPEMAQANRVREFDHYQEIIRVLEEIRREST